MAYIARSFLLRSSSASFVFHQKKNRIFSSSNVVVWARTLSQIQSTTTTRADNKKNFILVIVESPSKCKTLQNILNHNEKEDTTTTQSSSYVVTSCYGHVRNLPKRGLGGGSNLQEQKHNLPYNVAGIHLHNYEPIYEIIPGKEHVVQELQRLAQKASKIILATDPDREGEAMAWHLEQLLSQNSPNIPMERVSFTEITSQAIWDAINNPVQVNQNLVQAQETRRILDRLAGFTVSPVLWKKITPGLSAGRVQSVGMALVVQRERERLMFEPTEYWDLQAYFGPELRANLHAINGTVVANAGSDFAPQGQTLRPESQHKRHLSKEDADRLAEDLKDAEFKIIQMKSTRRSQNPPLPYKTSTLQQDSNRRLGISVQQTMQVAQKLYENGMISYMRTDSTTLSEEAENAIQSIVRRDYQLEAVRGGIKSKKKSKFAQEAHEAIRPAIQKDNMFIKPDILDMDELSRKTYDMIYRRTVASRMPPLVTNVTSILIEATAGETTVHFRASGSIVLSPGYTLALGRSDSDHEFLPDTNEGDILSPTDIRCMEHFTQPPPRYNEASFVKELEALGVGRPSTYAGIVQILRNRAYVGSPSKGKRSIQSRQASGSAISAQRAAGGEEFTSGPRGPLVPSLTAFAVCDLLEKHCPSYVDPDFTARMEENLDEIASGDKSGKIQRLEYLRNFYEGEDGLAARVKYIEDNVDASDSRRVRLPALDIANDDIGLFVGPWGPYIQPTQINGEKPPTAQLPQELSSSVEDISYDVLKSLLETKQSGGILLGEHPDDGRPIRLKSGRFGSYLQWGDDDDATKSTHSLPRDRSSASYSHEQNGMDDEFESPGSQLLSLEEAVGYVSLPRVVGLLHDRTITASIGPYGPYLKYNNTFLSLQDHGEDVLGINLERASELVTEFIINGKRKLQTGVLAEVGEKDGSPVTVKTGRFGPYINWNRVNANLPQEFRSDPTLLTLDQAWELLESKRQKMGTKTGRKSTNKSDLPPAPKRPKSAYLFFCDEMRPEVTKESPSSLGIVSKKLAKMWANASDKQRDKYNQMASEARKEYEARMVEWREECSKLASESSKKGQGRKGTMESSLPKRPKSAYLFFCDEKRPIVAENTNRLGEISKELARLWSETTDRSKYEELAAADKLRFESEKSQVNGISTQKKPTKQKSPRAPSAYMLFCKDLRSTIVDPDGKSLPLGETTKRLAEMWKNCDSLTRAKYESKAAEEKEKLLSSTTE